VSTRFGIRILRDVALGISILVLAALMFVLRMYNGGAISVSWFGFAGTTIVLFWYSAQAYKHYWRAIRFWVTLAGILVCHTLVFTAVLLHWPQWPLLWLMPVGIVKSNEKITSGLFPISCQL
jgi:hypothetical protein